MAEASGPGWGWIAYSSGVTAAILLSELSQEMVMVHCSYVHVSELRPGTNGECGRWNKNNKDIQGVYEQAMYT
ncbi:hypothetical protein YC2023_084079 [Brassica napus]